MYISNSSSGMATLLQQKNCIKSLTNGGSSVNNGNAGGSNQPQSGSSPSVVVANGALSGISIGNGNNHQQVQQPTHMIASREMVSIPIGSINSTGSAGLRAIAATGVAGNFDTNSGGAANNTHGAFLVAASPTSTYQQTYSHPLQQTQVNQNNSAQILSTNNLSNYIQNNQFRNIEGNSINLRNHNHQSLLSTATGTSAMFGHNQTQRQLSTNISASTTPSGTVQATRYFSQFSSSNLQQQQQQLQTSPALPSTTSILSSSSLASLTSTNATSFNHRTNNTTQILLSNNNNSGAIIGRAIQQQLIPNQYGPPTTLTTSAVTAPNNKSLITTSTSVDSRYNYENSIMQQLKTGAEISANGKNNGAEVDQHNSSVNGVPNGGEVKLINENSANTATAQQEAEQEPEPEIDIVINNVVCSFSVRCHLNLREIALNGFNVEFRRENGMVTMKLRRPYTTASIWSSGRITCTGATSEVQAKIAARRYARCLQKLGFKVRFHHFRVVNVLGTCSMPWAIKIVNFSEKYKKEASYEPELHPGVTYKLRYPKATLKIFSTGSVTVTAASVAHVQAAIEHIFPLVYEFRKKRSPEELEVLRLKQLAAASHTSVVTVNEEPTIDLLHSPPSTPATSKTLAATTASLTTSSVPIVNKSKRKRIADDIINDSNDVDDPIGGCGDAEIIDLVDEDDVILISRESGDDIIMVSDFDNPEDLIEGPDDGEDDL